MALATEEFNPSLDRRIYYNYNSESIESKKRISMLFKKKQDFL